MPRCDICDAELVHRTPERLNGIVSRADFTHCLTVVGELLACPGYCVKQAAARMHQLRIERAKAREEAVFGNMY